MFTFLGKGYDNDFFFTEMPKSLHDIAMQQLTSMLLQGDGKEENINDRIDFLTNLIFPQLLESGVETKKNYIKKLGLPESVSKTLFDKIQLAENEWSESLIEAQEEIYDSRHDETLFWHLFQLSEELDEYNMQRY